MTLRPTLYSAAWVFPVAQPPLRNAALLVGADGIIERVGRISDFQLADDVARVDLGEAAIIPGLVNVHAHPELAAFRGLLEDLPFHLWIPSLMRCKRGAQLTEDDYAAAARWTCVESLRSGVTTVGATEDSGAAGAALAAAGMRGVVFLEVFGPSPDQAETALAELREKVEKHADVASDRIRIGVSPHAPYTVSDALYSLVAGYARSESLPVATHAAEAEAEELLVRDGAGPFAGALRTRGIETPPRGRSTIDMLLRTGIMDCKPLLIHAVRASTEDLRVIADFGATIGHCPVANARLGHGVAPIAAALEAGITVGIGTDSVASNNRLDLLEEARHAQILQRVRLESASALPSDQLLRMATLDGARVLGMADRIGSLEPGKAADFCVVAMAGAHCIPVLDAASTLFHAARGSDVVMTVVDGLTLFANGAVNTLAEDLLHTQMEDIGRRLCAARDAP